jgi:hypothetical protein
MAWILLVSRLSKPIETAIGVQAMRHQNTVFHSLLKMIPRPRFEATVRRFGGDYR